MLTVEELLARARTASGQQTKYKLGAGGMDPRAPGPANINGECDCSGFVCWCLGMSRKTDHPFYVRVNGGWINTDAIVADASHSTGFFTSLTAPRLGALVVFPSKAPARKVGHVGIITQLGTQTVVASVLHCSAGNSRKGDAICETPPTVFGAPDAIYAWYEGIA